MSGKRMSSPEKEAQANHIESLILGYCAQIRQQTPAGKESARDQVLDMVLALEPDDVDNVEDEDALHTPT